MKSALNVSLGPAPWEEVFDSITGGSRSEARRALTTTTSADNNTPTALTAGPDAEVEIVDAEPVDPEPDPPSISSTPAVPHVRERDDRERDDRRRYTPPA